MEEARNPEEDLEVFNKSTQGKWKPCGAKDGCGLVWSETLDIPIVIANGDPKGEFFKLSKETIVDNAEFIAMAHEALPWYIQQYQQMLSLLKQIEWDGDNSRYGCCPYCRQETGDGHSAGCKLAKLLYNHGETEVDKTCDNCAYKEYISVGCNSNMNHDENGVCCGWKQEVSK